MNMGHATKFVLIALMLAGGASMANDVDVKPDHRLDIRIQRDIEKYRKSDAVITVSDRRGRPIEGASVQVEQVTHDFLFGCNIFMLDRFSNEEENAKYRDLFKRLLNYATLPFYWRGFEPKPGEPAYERVDHIAEWCNANGIATKGHPLIWTNEAGVPKWLDESSPDEVKRLMEARAKEIVARYEGRIDIWDVVNESTHTRTFADMTLFDYTSDPVKWADEACPGAMLIVNEFGVIGGSKGRKFFNLLKEMKDAGVPYDAIGIQTHMHGGVLPIYELLKALDKFAELGKPVHFTETTVLSGRETSTPEEERKQAEYVREFYRACFSHKAVRAITWWDFSDRGA